MRHSLVFFVIYIMLQLKSLGQCPTVDAGPNQTSCCQNSSTLNGSLSSPASIVWTTSGTGTFVPDATTLNASYTPSIGDCLVSAVILTLGGIPGCPSATDDMVLYINSTPTVYAGPDQTICCGGSATLAGNVSGTTSITWTSTGGGTFSPSNTVLNAVYSPSAAECAGGSATLKLEATGCSLVSDDQMTIYINTNPPAVDAGPDQTICTTVSNVSLLATSAGASNTTWTTSGTGNFGDANQLSTTYTPSSGDITTGNVTLTITSTSGVCAAATSEMILQFTNCTGTFSKLDLQEFKIYPSPSDGLVSVELSSELSIEAIAVFNSLQQLVIMGDAITLNGNKATLDFTDLNSGVYVIQLSDGKSVGIYKLIVE